MHNQSPEPEKQRRAILADPIEILAAGVEAALAIGAQLRGGYQRTREIARWHETGEVAYERDFALRLTLDAERIVRIVVMPGGVLPLDSHRP